MYAKTVTLGGTHWEQTNEILLRNRRIGCRYAFVNSASPDNMGSLFVPLPCVDLLCVVLVRDRVFYPHLCGNFAALLSCVVLGSTQLIQLITTLIFSPLIRTHLRSMSGLAQFVAARGLGTLKEWCEEGYKAVAQIDKDLSGEIRRVVHRPVK